MTTTKAPPRSHKLQTVLSWSAAGVVALSAVVAGAYVLTPQFAPLSYSGAVDAASSTPAGPPPPPPLNVAEYKERLLALAHVATTSPWYTAFLAGTTTIVLPGGTSTMVVAKRPWPTFTALPQDGRALLPFNRIVAYYGNFYSAQMGVLGEYPEAQVLAMLASTSELWAKADPTTPIVPAIEYIAVTAQAGPGKDGMYRARMPDSQIDKALAMAAQVHGIVILDVQVGLSTLQAELPVLQKYLAMPQVELAIDPEFSMKDGVPPGREIGTFSADDINYAINYLSQLVTEHDLPPKFLVVHRFTEDMVTGYKNITPTPQVQVVMDMDGWGYQAKKLTTYHAVIAPEPVQFTGIKLFYKNDTRPPSKGLLSTTTILNLTPAPIYIQYQ